MGYLKEKGPSLTYISYMSIPLMVINLVGDIKYFAACPTIKYSPRQIMVLVILNTENVSRRISSIKHIHKSTNNNLRDLNNPKKGMEVLLKYSKTNIS